ncbi:tripartite tricarboxylate transporter substrate binding protein [Pseudoroseomonas cervicalis]|uniref:Bug family tripartite tricarboxylate transporter substrate binding protein n=1 Tax=Teichococcus cervicalis TaxID=204525 RepID=UPI002785FCD7|nr:tripartite tricarboxylate transporter substrate binding protein [Pseudoroseomonas cervicalis]MDQ1080056.1 tripartite-type tricarboxylate transporter receptor subunit TctC [Pseudoroseomonas cervicalis]
MRRRTLSALLGGLPLLPALPRAAGAQGAPAAPAGGAWPNRPVTMLVPFVAGGPSDIVARAISNRMSQTIGQTVVVENRPGANGEIAGRALARAEPDGYTLMTGSIGVFAINAALRPDLGYDPVKEFAPVTLAVTTPNVLVVNPERVPVRDVAGLIAWLKSTGRNASYSTSGVGSSDQMTAELFKQRTGTDVAHVPYRGGAAAATDLIAGNVQMSFQNLGTVAGHIQSGRLRALMVTDSRRHPVLPDVPTSAEAGIEDFVVTSWQAVMAPSGMPAALRGRVHAAVAEALRHPEVQPRLEQIGLSVVANTPEDYSRFQQAEIARWREVIQRAGIKPE